MHFDSGFSSFNSMYSIFFIIFILFLVLFIISIIKNIGQWNKNNNSPVLTVDAKLVTKRTQISHNNFNDNNINNISSTNYYITFQVESGDRIEFHVNPSEYGMLVEGDIGKLTFQGTRYKKFNRIK